MQPQEQQIPFASQKPEDHTLTPGAGELHHKKNLYPYVRHVLLAAAVLLALALIFFLIYQNGKSIYDNGL